MERSVEQIMKNLDGKDFQDYVKILMSVIEVLAGPNRLFEQRTVSILRKEVGLTCATAL